MRIALIAVAVLLATGACSFIRNDEAADVTLSTAEVDSLADVSVTPSSTRAWINGTPDDETLTLALNLARYLSVSEQESLAQIDWAKVDGGQLLADPIVERALWIQLTGLAPPSAGKDDAPPAGCSQSTANTFSQSVVEVGKALVENAQNHSQCYKAAAVAAAFVEPAGIGWALVCTAAALIDTVKASAQYGSAAETAMRECVCVQGDANKNDGASCCLPDCHERDCGPDPRCGSGCGACDRCEDGVCGDEPTDADTSQPSDSHSDVTPDTTPDTGEPRDVVFDAGRDAVTSPADTAPPR